MRKWAALVLALVMMTLLLTACGEQDPEKVAATVVAEVNGEKITKGEAQTVYDFLMNQMVTMNAQSGYQVDRTDKDVVATLKMNTLGVLTEGLALDQKLAELGNGFTEADREGFKTAAQTEYDSIVETFVTQNGMTEEEAKSAIDGMGYSLDAMEFMLYREELETRLSAYALADVAVTDEEIQSQYDALVAEAESAYAANPGQFVSDKLNGATVYTNPEGFRYVKNLVVGFPEDINTLITEKDTEYFGFILEQYNTQAKLDAGTELSDEEKADLQTQIDGFNADFDRLEAEIEALKKQGFEQMRPEAEEILAKAKESGADFDALIEEYSIDKAEGEMKEKGYPVTAGISSYVPSFTEGAMALENIGDISDLIESDYGYHILVYTGDVEAGPVPLDDVREEVTAQAKTTKEAEVFTQKLTEWINAAKIQTYINRF